MEMSGRAWKAREKINWAAVCPCPTPASCSFFRDPTSIMSVVGIDFGSLHSKVCQTPRISPTAAPSCSMR